MMFCTTRGGVTGAKFEEALFSGYAQDGGLYMPNSIPVLTKEELLEWSHLTYPQITAKVLRKFISSQELPDGDLQGIVDKCFKRFCISEVIRVEKLNGNLNIIELFHGPTLAFKDLALSVVGNLLEYFVQKKKKHTIILVSTSGDTGSAAIESVRHLKCVDIIVLIPYGYCTHIQELQMTTVMEDNVHVFFVDKSLNGIDADIKRCFDDPSLSADHAIISINSINVARIIAQIPHYIYAYYKICKEVGKPVEIIVPTGFAGNITAGCMAQKMGLPLKLVASVNLNDVMARILNDGDFSLRLVQPSFASAMNVEFPYNLERLLYLFNGNNSAEVREIMASYENNGKVLLPSHLLMSMRETLTAVVTDELKIIDVMARIAKEYNYILCPHTATAVAYHFDSRAGGLPRGYIATASPAKFPEAVEQAGAKPVVEGVNHLSQLPTRFTVIKKEERCCEIIKKTIEYVAHRVSGGNH